MTERNEELETASHYRDHPLYGLTLEQLAAGEEDDAATTLGLLLSLFPNEPELQDLVVRTKLRRTLANGTPVVVERGGPTPVLRQILLFLLAITVCIVAIAALTVAYDRFVSPARENTQQEALIQELLLDGQKRIDAGDWGGARESFTKLVTRMPGDPTAEAALSYIDEQAALDRLYVDAIAAQQRGDWPSALDLLAQIRERNAEYRDIQQRIQIVQRQQDLETEWQDAQNLIQSGDIQTAIPLLRQIRSRDPSFRRDEVEEELFSAYVELAKPLLEQANGNVDPIREALGYMTAALSIQPNHQDLVQERRLATEFVAGADEAAQGDWASAASHWEFAASMRPDYQNGALAGQLNQAYPLAAQQLIAQANGSVSVLTQAIHYLNQALLLSPNDEKLLEERRLATEFINGAEVFQQQMWTTAIGYWGPIYTARPEYQMGALKRNLRTACSLSPEPDGRFCPP